MLNGFYDWQSVEHIAAWVATVSTGIGFFASLPVAFRTSKLLRHLLRRVPHAGKTPGDRLANRNEKLAFISSLIVAVTLCIGFFASACVTFVTGKLEVETDQRIASVENKSDTAINTLSALAQQIRDSGGRSLSGEQVVQLTNSLHSSNIGLCLVTLADPESAAYGRQFLQAAALSGIDCYHIGIGLVTPPKYGIQISDPDGISGKLFKIAEELQLHPVHFPNASEPCVRSNHYKPYTLFIGLKPF